MNNKSNLDKQEEEKNVSYNMIVYWLFLID